MHSGASSKSIMLNVTVNTENQSWFMCGGHVHRVGGSRRICIQKARSATQNETTATRVVRKGLSRNADQLKCRRREQMALPLVQYRMVEKLLL